MGRLCAVDHLADTWNMLVGRNDGNGHHVSHENEEGMMGEILQIYFLIIIKDNNYYVVS